MKNHALVAGATGVVGRSMMEYVQTLADWRVTGLARRAESASGSAAAAFRSVDLLDPSACQAFMRDHSEVTHLFFAAYAPKPEAAEEAAVNLRMLRNLVEAADEYAPGLQHVQLMQGSKWYGSHIGPYRTPAREEQPRHPQAAFYFAQQQWLIERQRGCLWHWSALRPHGIWGFATRSTLSPMNAIALYAIVMKSLGMPLHFPGKAAAYDAIYQCTDSAHLARGMLWAATSPRAANEVFNLTNGDYVRWRFLWPRIASWFDMEVGDVIPMSLSSFMADKEPLWSRIVEHNGLEPHRLHELTFFGSAERFIFNAEWDQMSAVTKAQRAGWTEVIDTYEMVPRQLQRLVDERVIPAPEATLPP